MSVTILEDRVDLICEREYGSFNSEGVRALVRENPQLAVSLILPAGIEYVVPVLE